MKKDTLKPIDYTPKDNINDFLNELNSYFSDDPTETEQNKISLQEQYLKGYPNLKIYKDLTEGENSGLWEPINFFNQLYEQVKRLIVNIEKPYTVVDYLLELPFNGKQKIYLLDHIAERVLEKSTYKKGTASVIKDPKLYFASCFLSERNMELARKLYPEDYIWEVEVKPSPPSPWHYPFIEVQREIDKFPNSESKIKYLIKSRTEYQQTYPPHPSGREAFFVSQCNLEIEKIKQLSELECKQPESTPKQEKISFKFSGEKSKIDLILVLNAIYELRFITLENDQLPDKKLFMEKAGDFFGINLTKYHSNLSQALKNGTLENNYKVFEEMKKVIKRKMQE